MTDTHGKAKKGRNGKRRVLMIGGVAVVAAVCAAMYVTSGRYIGTDNAYVKAAKILVTPQVSGSLIAVPVSDNQNVAAGETLFVIDPAAYQIAVDEAQADLAAAQAQIAQLKAKYRQLQQEMAGLQAEADFAVKEFERKQPLADRGAVSRSVLDEAVRERDFGLARRGSDAGGNRRDAGRPGGRCGDRDRGPPFVPVGAGDPERCAARP